MNDKTNAPPNAGSAFVPCGNPHPARATLKLAVEQDHKLTAAQQTVVWTGADWRVLLPEPGTETDAQPLTNLDGFVALHE